MSGDALAIGAMKPLRFATDIDGNPIDRDTRRARLLAARTRPVGGINRRAILTGYWDGGKIVGAFRAGRGGFKKPSGVAAET